MMPATWSSSADRPAGEDYRQNTRFGAKAEPLALAAEQSFTDSLLASTNVASQPHPDASRC